MTRSTATPQTVSGSTAVKVALLCSLGLLVVASVRFARFDWTGIPLERGKAVQERVVSEDCTEYIRPYTTSSGRTISPVSVDEQQYLSMVDLFSGRRGRTCTSPVCWRRSPAARRCRGWRPSCPSTRRCRSPWSTWP